MRLLVVGDSYVPVPVFERGLAPLADGNEIEYLQLEEEEALTPATPSERSLKEYLGTPSQLVDRMDGVEALVVHGAPVTDAVLDASPALRLVCCARGGPVNVDVQAATVRGLPVVTTPGKNAEAVADQTIAFLIMLARRFPRAQRFLQDGGLLGESAFEGSQFFGHELGGHLLGLVGYGHVGRKVATRAVAFGMSIVVYDPYLALEPGEVVEQVDELPLLLERSHFVSLHARATPENDNLFGGEQFAAMREGACFLNTARETLVDEEALAEALASGRLAGAALDVLRPSLAPGPHPLLAHPNVVITPHIGGATHETLLRGVTMIAQEIGRYVRGDQLLHLANPAVVHG